MRRVPALLLALATATAPPAFAQGHGRQVVKGHVVLPRGGFPRGLDPGAARLAANRRLDAMLAAPGATAPLVPSSSQWTAIGPRPTVYTPNGERWGAWTSSTVVDPNDPSTVYIGNPGSGVWKTTDAGAHWTPMTDGQASLAIGSIALAPSNPSIVYAGTGSWSYGVGVLKSTDAGGSWTLFSSPFAGPTGPSADWDGGASVQALAVHPTNPDVVLAGVFRGNLALAGVYRSTNGGSTWTQVLSGGRSLSVLFDPSDPSLVYTAIGEYYAPNVNSFYTSTHGGASWASINSGIDAAKLTSGSDIRLAMCAASPSTLYATILSQYPFVTLAVVKTTNGGASWTSVPAPAAERDYKIAVSPVNANLVFLGDVRLRRSTDGGATWSAPILYDEFRSMAFSSDGSVLYTGGDFGMHRIAPPLTATTWTYLNDALQTQLFYSPMALHPTEASITFGGAQDLGILRSSGSLEWAQGFNCDGGASIVDPVNPSNVYATCQGTQIVKSTSGGLVNTWTHIESGITTSDPATFLIPLAMDPANPERLLTATNRVYQTTNGGGAWAPISGDLAQGCDYPSRSIAVAPSNAGTVYYAQGCGAVWVSTNALAASPTWTKRSSGVPSRDVEHVVVDPADASHAWIVLHGFSYGADTVGHVMKTTDAGQHWTDASGNLPNIPAYELALDPDLPGTMFLATDIGVFGTSDGGGSWTPLANGLPRASVRSIRVHRPSRTLRIATFGRGMWQLALSPRGDVNGDGIVDVLDVFYLINRLFASGPAPLGPANVNGDQALDVLDVFYLINFLFAGGPVPV
jgi:photosystem II stability/assembly factor-like uncharacterized protein